MQDLFQNYVSDLNKLRDAFHSELAATAEDLSKAMGLYASRSEAALVSFMEKVSTRGVELEAVGGGEAQSVSWSSGKRWSPGRRHRTARAYANKCGCSENRKRRRAGGHGRSACRERWGSQAAVGPPNDAC